MHRLAIFLISATLFCFPLQAKEKGKVALLFLMVGEHSQAKLWGELMKGEGGRFNAYVHNKEWVGHPFFVLHMVQRRVKTTWMEHINAWRYLLRTALMDPCNERFIFLSDSCVPLHPMRAIYQQLMQEKRSWINYFRPWWPPEDNRELVEIPQEHRFVNSEWMVLNRKHAQLMVEDNLIVHKVQNHPHSAEGYAATLFSFYNCLEGETVNKGTTHVNFLRGVDSHPYTFDEATAQNVSELRQAKKEGSFFARKIGKNFPPEALWKIIRENN